MPLSQWVRPPRHLLILFLATTLVPATALGWLSWRLLQQDRALENQRLQERLDRAADLVAAASERALDEVEHQLATLAALRDSQLAVAALQGAQRLTDDALLIVLRRESIASYPGTRLLYYPLVPRVKEPSASVFARGEIFEFRQKDYAKAIEVFRGLARSKETMVRAGALLRLGRNLRKASQRKPALAVYDELALLGSTPVAGLPAELLARESRCALFQEMKQPAELRREAESLYGDLNNGRWPLTRAAYRFYASEAQKWLGADGDTNSRLPEREADDLALAGGVESVWEEWQRIRRGEGNPAGHRSLWVYNRSVLLLWHSTPERSVALVAGARYCRRQWLAALAPILERQRVEVVLTDTEGHPVLGRFTHPGAQQAVRTPADTGLPWTLHIAGADPRADLAQLAGRRRLVFAGLAIMSMLVLAGSYFIARAVTRELEVARLQSDFVSAVSHEFRTPLASLCQLSELLADGRVPGEEHRQEYYRGLLRESLRLHRLVEGLLDFGRMEAGAREYRFESLETSALVRGVAEEFAHEVSEQGYGVEIIVNENLPRVRGDREALSRALRNLLENAVKYSPACKTVWLEAACRNGLVAICVRDRGLGIAPNEQKQIFKKFVRAASAEAAGVKGTGLGLAMVDHIVRAHGGEVRLESQPGFGSTFTVVLPTAEG